MSNPDTHETVSKFHLSNRSLKRLSKAHIDLQRVIKRAIELSTVDFTVLEVVRTVEKQRIYVRTGVSWTMNSRHIPTQPKNPHYTEEVSHAVDLGVWIDNKVVWAWGPYFEIAKAVQLAAIELDIDVEWGGCQKSLLDSEDPQQLYTQYISNGGKHPDGPHFQLSWKAYPIKLNRHKLVDKPLMIKAL